MEKTSFRPDILIFDFDKTLTSDSTCYPQMVSLENANESLLGDRNFLEKLITTMQEQNIPVVIASFGKEEIIVKILNLVLTDNYFRLHDDEHGMKNVFGNDCIEMKPCANPNSIKNKVMRENFKKLAETEKTKVKERFPCTSNLTNYDSALGKLLMIDSILKYYNLNQDANILFYDDSERNVTIFEESAIKDVYKNLRAYRVYSATTISEVFCDSTRNIDQGYFKKMCSELHPLEEGGELMINSNDTSPDLDI